MVMVATASTIPKVDSMRAGSGNETCDHKHAKKNTVRWELRDRENQVEDQHDDEC